VKTQVENISEVKKIIHVEIPWEDVDKHIRQTVRQLSRNARIPGFRPGKAPDSLIRSRYAQHIREDVINHLVPEAYRDVLASNQFDIVSEPSLHDVMYSEGSPFLFKVTIETRPSIELKEYKGFELKRTPLEVKDEEVESILKDYQDRAAELIPVEGDAQKGHYLNARVKATIDAEGKKQTLFDNRTMIAVGSEDNHPAFNEHLTGKKAGETVEFDIDYPADSPEKSVAGKTVHYEVQIESVNEKRLAPLDDEFAKDLGDFSSLADLREKIRTDVLNIRTKEQRAQWKDDILKRLIEENPFEVPEGLVKKETESLLHNYAHSLQQRGVKLDKAEIDWNDVQGKLSRQADQNVRGSMIIESIAQKEKIEVSDEDLEHAIQEIADQQRRAPEAIKAEIMKEERMESLKRRVLFSKTMDFLVDNAKFEETVSAEA
jgi:trigger factor